MTFSGLVLCFAFYSFAGWCMETLYACHVFKKYVKRGFLRSCFCPIYGFGALTALFAFRVSGLLFGSGAAGLAVGVVFSSVLFTLLEFGAGAVLERLFGQRYWDYSNYRFNVCGLICPQYSLLWGALGFLFIRFLHPAVSLAAEALPVSVRVGAAGAFLAFILADAVASALRRLEDTRLRNIRGAAREAILSVWDHFPRPL